MIIRRDLCAVGKSLNSRIDEAIRYYRTAPPGKEIEAAEQICSALRAYFGHRNDCSDCKITVITERNNGHTCKSID